MGRYDFYSRPVKASVDLDGVSVDAVIIFDYVGNIVYINQIIYRNRDIKSIVSASVEAELERSLYRLLGR